MQFITLFFSGLFIATPSLGERVPLEQATGTSGACCFFAPVACFNNTEIADCESVGGSFLGVGLTCNSDADSDGVAGCQDRCPLDPEKLAPGECGCGVAEEDVDQDGVPDCLDECPATELGVEVLPNGCAAVGACCFANGVCFDESDPRDCRAARAAFQGYGTECAAGCPIPVGGDADNDGDLDLFDFSAWPDCMLGPLVASTFANCPRLNMNADDTVDLRDFAGFENGFRICLDEPDIDADTIADGCDNCPTMPNEDQADADGDGVGNVCETDADHDGHDDNNDNCPGAGNTNQLDADHDAHGDVCDNCPNTPANERPVDANGCSISQRDTDNDGVKDNVDECPSTDMDDRPVNAEGCGPAERDTDNDGVLDADDNCPNDSNALQEDGDADGVGNACDACPTSAPGTVVGETGCIPPRSWIASPHPIAAATPSTYLAPEVYDIGNDGNLSLLHLNLASAASIGDSYGLGPATILASEVPFGQRVDIYRVTFPFGTITESMLVHAFSLAVSGTSATWTFDVEVRSIEAAGAQQVTTTFRYQGTRSGNFIEDPAGGIIFWQTVTGTLRTCDQFGCDDDNLSSYYTPPGTWLSPSLP